MLYQIGNSDSVQKRQISFSSRQVLERLWDKINYPITSILRFYLYFRTIISANYGLEVGNDCIVGVAVAATTVVVDGVGTSVGIVVVVIAAS